MLKFLICCPDSIRYDQNTLWENFEVDSMDSLKILIKSLWSEREQVHTFKEWAVKHKSTAQNAVLHLCSLYSLTVDGQVVDLFTWFTHPDKFTVARRQIQPCTLATGLSHKLPALSTVLISSNLPKGYHVGQWIPLNSQGIRIEQAVLMGTLIDRRNPAQLTNIIILMLPDGSYLPLAFDSILLRDRIAISKGDQPKNLVLIPDAIKEVKRGRKRKGEPKVEKSLELMSITLLTDVGPKLCLIQQVTRATIVVIDEYGDFGWFHGKGSQYGKPKPGPSLRYTFSEIHPDSKTLIMTFMSQKQNNKKWFSGIDGFPIDVPKPVKVRNFPKVLETISKIPEIKYDFRSSETMGWAYVGVINSEKSF